MNPTTREFLRQAAMAALEAQDDEAALDLLNLMQGHPPAPQAIQSLPPAREVINAPARDYHFWASLIREQFIPFLRSNGRHRFTSHELLTWVENRPDIEFTAGDMDQHRNGREVWRSIISAALSALKSMGVIHAAPHSRDYRIACPSLNGTAPALFEEPVF